MRSSDVSTRDERGTWVFGYGSLVWRPAFPHVETRPASVRGWRRRFWQGSTDHRGVPGAPGRVVTLVRESGEPALACWGVAYLVRAGDLDAVLAGLDHREKGGYDRIGVELHFQRDTHQREEVGGSGDARPDARGLMYVATESNPNFLGPAPLEAIARQVFASHGPSGSNPEYVWRLAEALRELCPSLDPQSEETLALAALLDGVARAERSPKAGEPA